MKKIILLAVLGVLLSADMCSELMKIYHTPDPAIKTMKQLKRWVRKHMKNVSKKDKETVLNCLLEKAADNPNKVSVAGE